MLKKGFLALSLLYCGFHVIADTFDDIVTMYSIRDVCLLGVRPG